MLRDARVGRADQLLESSTCLLIRSQSTQEIG